MIGEVVKMATVKHQPTFEILPSEAGGCLVVVIWPKGPEQQLGAGFYNLRFSDLKRDTLSADGLSEVRRSSPGLPGRARRYRRQPG